MAFPVPGDPVIAAVVAVLSHRRKDTIVARFTALHAQWAGSDVATVLAAMDERKYNQPQIEAFLNDHPHLICVGCWTAARALLWSGDSQLTEQAMVRLLTAAGLLQEEGGTPVIPDRHGGVMADEAVHAYDWVGINSDGERRIGTWNTTPSGLAGLVESMFGDGKQWKLLNVWDSDQFLVAGIGPDPDDLADLVWWAQGSGGGVNA